MKRVNIVSIAWLTLTMFVAAMGYITIDAEELMIETKVLVLYGLMVTEVAISGLAYLGKGL